MDEIVNKVAQSGIITIDPAEFISEETISLIDIAPVLWQGLVLKEKDFRAYISSVDWSAYAGKNVALFCSSDAILPAWAFMLLTSALKPYAAEIIYGDRDVLIREVIRKKINQMDPEQFRDARVVIKGCADFDIDPSIYMELTSKLVPVVKSLMFGEPCSTVPVFKRK